MRRFSLQRRHFGILVVAISLVFPLNSLAHVTSLAADIGPVEDSLFYDENTSLPPALESNQCAAGKDLRKGVAPRIPGVAMVACPTMKFNCYGQLVRWRMLSIKDNGMTAHLIVWRPTGEAGVHTFVGKISRQMNQKGYIEIVVTDSTEQIRVQPGDFVGVAYDPRSYGGVVPWATLGYADTERDHCVTVAVFGQDLDIPGKIFSLGETYVDRILMLQAIVEVGVAEQTPPRRVTISPSTMSTYGDSSQNFVTSVVSRAPSSVGSCSTGIPIQAEPISRIPGNFLNVCPTMKITCDGQLQRWEFFSALEDGTPAYLAVFRPASESEPSKFYLVGMTRVVATHFGPASYDIPSSERFYVQTGDVLGVLYDAATSIGVVPFVDERVLDGYRVSDLQICLKKRVFVEDIRSSNAALDFGDTQTKRLVLIRAHVQGGSSMPPSRSNQASSPVAQRSSGSRHTVMPPSQLAEMAMAMQSSASGDSCQVGPHLSNRVPTRRPGVWLNVCPNVMAPCAGRIRRWQIMSAADDNTPTYLSVWRQVSEGKRKYRLVGYNQVQADTLGLRSYDIAEADRISVQAGDLIGVMYDSSARAGSVGFADHDETEGFASEDFTNCFRARISKQDADANAVQDFGETMQQRLVLMSAMIESAATDACPPPPVVSNARVLKIVEQTITYACQAGYAMEDERATVTCREGAWTRTPKCIKASCAETPSIENGYIGGGSSEVGASRNVKCNEGFQLSDDSSPTVSCHKGGTWSQSGRCVPTPRPTTTPSMPAPAATSPAAAPLAAATSSAAPPPPTSNRCGRPPEVPGGRLSGGSGGQQYGDTRQYKCDTGYVMTGNSVIVCLDSGQWTRPPVCNPIQPSEHAASVDCGEPQPVDHAVLRGQGTKEGTERWFDCEAGYVMQNFPRVVCQSDGQWSTPPACLPLVCPHPPQVNMATRQFSSRLYNSVATYKCARPDCVMLGVSELRCAESGQWQPKPPTCLCGNEQEAEESNSCPDPPVISNGYWMVNKLPTGEEGATNRSIGAVLEMRCNDCYERAGSSTPFIRCGRQLLWTTTQLYCKIVDCSSDTLPTIEHGTISDGLSTCNSSRTIVCDPGYVRSGGSSIVCQSDSYWSNPAPRCVVGTGSSSGSCGDVPMIRSGRIDDGGYFVGARRTVTCDSGYRIDTGPFVVFCQSDGTWSRPPNCTQSGCPAPQSNVGVQYSYNEEAGDTGVYPVGTRATFDCKYGYKLLVPAMLTCTEEGSWDGAQGLCQRIRCYNLPQVNRGYYRPSSDEPYNVDTTAMLVCSPGLKPFNATTIKCDITGNWEQPGICVPACAAVPSVANGRYILNTDNAYPGTIATLQCEAGYDISGGDGSITCLTDGSWTSSGSICRMSAPKCSGVPEIEHGSIVIGASTVGSRGRITCDSGYILIGPSNGTVCGADGTWSTTSYCQRTVTECFDGQPYVENGVVITEGVNVGDVGTLICNPGYELRGSGRVICEPDGSWLSYGSCVNASEQCLPEDLPDIANAQLIQTGVQTRWIIACHDGYVWDGISQFLVCLRNGTWTAPGRCLPINCGDPEVTEHGAFELTGTRLGSIAVLKCQVGYTVMGNNIIQCLSTGHWTQAGNCVRIMCEDVPFIDNGRYMLIQTHRVPPANSVIARLACDPGFTVHGSDILRCHLNGSWTSPGGSCVPSFIECGSEPTIANGFVTSGSSEVGASRMIQCNFGFMLSGPNSITCKADATWTNPGSCSRADRYKCGLPPKVRNARVLPTARNDRGHAWRIVCNPGFSLPDRKQWTLLACSKEGRWDPTPPMQCEEPVTEAPRCPELSVANAITAGTDSGIGASRQIICIPGYESPVRSVVCQASGAWSPAPPKSCLPKDCGAPRAVANGQVRPGGTRFGDIRYISCDDGYALSGPSNITCTPNGWSDLPTCTLGEAPAVVPSAEVSCDVADLPPILNGAWSRGPAGKFAKGACISQCYTLDGNPFAACLSDGSWNVSTAPSCIIQECGPIPVVQFSFTSPPVPAKTCGAKFRYICSTGYFQVGPQEAECGADGQWKFATSGVQTLCLRNVTERCTIRVPEIPGASINVGTDTVGSQRLVTCLPGYSMTPSQSQPVYLTCGPNLRWITPNITCALSGCDKMPTLDTTVEVDVGASPVGPYQSGSAIQVRCATDRTRELNGSNIVTCKTANTWSESPTCPSIVSGENCRVGHAVPYVKLAQMPRSLLACPTLSAVCGGDADTWVFYSALADGSEVGLRVYRPLGVIWNSDLKQNDTQYVLVNETMWAAHRVGRIVLPIEKTFRIMPGDFLGIHYYASESYAEGAAGSAGELKSVIPHADLTQLGTFNATDLVPCFYKPVTASLMDSVPQFISSDESGNFTWYGRDKMTMLPSLQLIIRKPGFCGQPEVEYGKSDYISSADKPGYVVQFKCREEYEIIGPRRATCGPDGEWSEFPTCELHQSIPCVAGRRDALASNQNRLVLPRQLYVFPDFKFNCSSRITEWHFWADAPFGNNTVIFLSMWRSFRGRLYYLIGSNRVPVVTRGLNIYKIPENEQYDVDADSFLGIHFASSDGPKFISYFDELHPGTLVPHQFSVFTSKAINEAELQEDMAKFGYLSMDPVDVQNRIAPAVYARGHSLAGCGLPPPTPYGRYQLSDGTRLDSRADYTCIPGTKPADGISSSVCQDDKTWSTPRPVCIKDDMCYSGRNGSRLPMVFSTSFLNIYTNYTFQCAGVVTRWNFFSRNYSAVIYLGVWRKERGLLNSYRLVGYTKVSTSKVGWTTYDVDDDQVIPVLKGDVIGVHYKETKLPQRDVGIGFATPLSSPREQKESFSYGFAQDTSHDEIMRNGGLVQFTGPHFSYWRLPSVMAVVQTTTLSCGRLPLVPHARVSGSGPGQFQYQCEPNYVLVGQSDTVTCQSDGRWTDPPVCKPSDDCDWNNLQDTNNRWEKYSGRSGNLKIFTSLPIGCQGWIKRWEFYSTQPAGQTVHLAVWRKLASGMMIQVMKNTFVTTGVGLQMHPVPADSQIQVMPGDYIGFHYNSFEDRIIPLGRPEDNIAEDLILDGYDEHLTETDLAANDARTMSQQKRAIGAPALRAYIINQQEKVYQPCIEDTRCPLQSICTYRPCLDRVCVCKPGFWPNADRTACVRSLVLGQACGSADSVCSVFGSYCDPQKQVCVCLPDFESTDTIQPARCRPVSPIVKRQALLGEHCDNGTNVCYDLYRSVYCDPATTKCTCLDSFRPATDDEITARPDELRQCLPVDYKLNSTYCPIVPQYQRAERGVNLGGENGPSSLLPSSSQSLVLPAVLASLAAICIGGVFCVAIVLIKRSRQRRLKRHNLFATITSSSVLSRNEGLALQRNAASPSSFSATSPSSGHWTNMASSSGPIPLYTQPHHHHPKPPSPPRLSTTITS